MPPTPLNDFWNGIVNYLSIFLDTRILAIATYLGIVLTIYYSVRVHRKSIRYTVAQKDDKYIIVSINEQI